MRTVKHTIVDVTLRVHSSLAAALGEYALEVGGDPAAAVERVLLTGLLEEALRHHGRGLSAWGAAHAAHRDARTPGRKAKADRRGPSLPASRRGAGHGGRPHDARWPAGKAGGTGGGSPPE